MKLLRHIHRPLSGAYLGLRSRIHLKHFRGERIHSPFMYGMVRQVFMQKRIMGDHLTFYRSAIEQGCKQREAVLLQNLGEYLHLKKFTWIDDREVKIEADQEMLLVLPKAGSQALIKSARYAAQNEICLVIVHPHRAQKGRKTALEICRQFPCVSVDRITMMILFFYPRIHPQYYRL